MIIPRCLLLAAILPAIVLPAQAVQPDAMSPWEGTWNGTLGQPHPWPISVTISQGKVVSFSEKGVSLDVRYTRITPTTVTFGDQVHYGAKLTRTGEATASASVHGRHGFETGSLTK